MASNISMKFFLELALFSFFVSIAFKAFMVNVPIAALVILVTLTVSFIGVGRWEFVFEASGRGAFCVVAFFLKWYDLLRQVLLQSF